MSVIYFDLKHALEEQRKIISLSGGLHGCREVDKLQSIIEFVKNDDYYKSLIEKVAYLLFSIAKNHVFLDGNKRTAIALSAYLLEINGYGERIGYYIVQMENIVIWVVENKIDRFSLIRIVASIMEKGEIEEDIQLELLSKIS